MLLLPKRPKGPKRAKRAKKSQKGPKRLTISIFRSSAWSGELVLKTWQCRRCRCTWPSLAKKGPKGPKRAQKGQKGPKRTKKDQKGPKRLTYQLAYLDLQLDQVNSSWKHGNAVDVGVHELLSPKRPKGYWLDHMWHTRYAEGRGLSKHSEKKEKGKKISNQPQQGLSK